MSWLELQIHGSAGHNRGRSTVLRAGTLDGVATTTASWDEIEWSTATERGPSRWAPARRQRGGTSDLYLDRVSGRRNEAH